MGKIKNKINNDNRKWWTLGTICFALFMILLDGNVVNLALPKIMQDFGANLSEIEWVNNAYLLTFAIFLLTFGRLGDKFGRKKFFIGGLALFTLGSFLCGYSQNTSQLILFRVIQAIGGSSMMPATLSLIQANFEKKERGMAMGLWGAVAGLAIVLGPIIGGYLTDAGLGESVNSWLNINEFWRYVFYINIPIGLVALGLSSAVIPESIDRKNRGKADISGIILSAVSLFLLTYALIEGSHFGWWKAKNVFNLLGKEISFGEISVIPVLFALSLIAGTTFILIEYFKKSEPIMDLKLFKSRNYSVGNLSGAVLNFAMMGSFFLLPLFLQMILGFSAIKTGQVLLPLAIAIMIMAPIAGRLSDKIGAKWIVITGMMIMSVGGYYLGHFSLDTTTKDLILPFIITGIGMGLSLSPLTNITLLDVPENEAGGASGVFSTTRQIGSVMGIAILGAVLQTSMSENIENKINEIDSLPPKAKALIVDYSSKGELQSGNTDEMKVELEKIMIEEYSKSESLNQKNLDFSTIDQSDPQTIKMMQEYQKQAEEKKSVMIKEMKDIGNEIENVSKQSFVDSINHTFRLSALIALLGALFSLLFRKSNIAKQS